MPVNVTSNITLYNVTFNFTSMIVNGGILYKDDSNPNFYILGDRVNINNINITRSSGFNSVSGFMVISNINLELININISLINWVNVNGQNLDSSLIEPGRNNILYNNFIEGYSVVMINS